jgi:hypothetical protein
MEKVGTALAWLLKLLRWWRPQNRTVFNGLFLRRRMRWRAEARHGGCFLPEGGRLRCVLLNLQLENNSLCFTECVLLKLSLQVVRRTYVI